MNEMDTWLTFSLHDEQLGVLLVAHHVQSGGDSSVKDSKIKVVFFNDVIYLFTL